MRKFLILLLIIIVGCKSNEIHLIDETTFNNVSEYPSVELYTLKNSNGLVTQITNFGGRVVNLWVPDKNGSFEDIVLGYSNLEGYLNSNEIYFGALIGRYANRIGNGKFSIKGHNYNLATNNGVNHLHGGKNGFNNVVWAARKINQQSLELTYVSKDNEEGYPGNLNIKVIYTLTDDDELKIEYWANTDQPTPVNLTHHSFFNLKGAGKGTINDHVLQLNAKSYTPVDQGLIPSGKIESVDGTPMDFTQPIEIGEKVNQNFEQLVVGLGYDHNWVLNKTGGDEVQFAAKITEPKSGRSMSVYTNEPGLQFYGGNFLDGSNIGKYETPYKHRTAFCLETQHYPDSPNKPNFPSTILNPDEEYYSICIYKFSTDKNL
ncbi:MAG: galactose mutarotase [Bacteroidetes bacterium]|nr:galactose mutarotase [Bacteroidota bacterium]